MSSASSSRGRPARGPHRRRRPPLPPGRRPAWRAAMFAWVTTTSASTGSNGSRIPRASLSRHHRDDADQPGEGEVLLQRARRGHRAGRVVRGVEQDGRRRADDLEPARRGHAGEGRAHEVEVEHRALDRGCRRGTPRPRRARRRRCAPGARRAAGGRCRRTPPPSPRSASSWPPTASARDRTPNSRPSRATSASTSTDRAQQHVGGVDGLLGEHAVGPRLDDAGLLGGDLLDRVAQEPLVVDRDRRDDSDLRVGDVGAVPGAADADLDDRRRRPARRRTPRTPCRSAPRRTTAAPRWRASTRSRYGSDLVVRRQEARRRRSARRRSRCVRGSSAGAGW